MSRYDALRKLEMLATEGWRIEIVAERHGLYTVEIRPRDDNHGIEFGGTAKTLAGAIVEAFEEAERLARRFGGIP